MAARANPAPGPVNIGQGALQAIFSVFLGLMITAFVGVGVYTFYPNPAQDTQERIETLYRDQNLINKCDQPGGCKASSQLTQAERDDLERIDKEIRALEQGSSQEMRSWAQRTSVILVVLATILMAISLALRQSVSVISNGVLLGGLFTMLYAVGWGIASGNSISRFLVLTAAVAISIGLGYLRFVRGRSAAEAAAPLPVAAGGVGPGLGSAQADELSQRVAALEQRLASVGALLGGATGGHPTHTAESVEVAGQPPPDAPPPPTR